MKTKLFDSYKNDEKRINPTLLWEYNLIDFDYRKMRDIVVHRVIERGWPKDWYALINLYSEEEIKESIKKIPYLNDKDMAFVSLIFELPLNELKCYTNKQLNPPHWNA